MEENLHETQLGKNEAYFISWLEELSLVGKRLESIQSYINSIISSKGPVEYEDVIKSEYFDWKINTFTRTIKPVVDAFLSISFGNGDIAKKNISWVEKIVNHCVDKNIFSGEYAQGIRYLCNLLKVDINLKFPTLEENDEVSMSTSFGDLTDKGKTMVWLAKCKFRDLFKEDNSTILNQIIGLDPNYWLWSWKLSNELRYTRKDDISPSDEEIKAILRSIELSKSTEFHAMCICDFCVVLAELLSHRVQNDLPHTALHVNNKTITSNQEFIDFIQTQASDALKNQNTHLDATTIRRYEIIFSEFFPPEFRNFEESMKYNKAFLKIIFKNCDGKPENKNFLFERKKIYRDFMYLIPELLKSRDQNSEKLNDLFATIWEYTLWDEHEDYSLHFLHGCYFSITEDVENALLHWMKMDFKNAVSSDVPFFQFIDFSYTLRIKMYNDWPESVNFHFDKVINEIQKRLNQEIDLPEKEKLSTLKLKLEGALKLETHNSLSTVADGISDLSTKINEINVNCTVPEEKDNEDLMSLEDAQQFQMELNNCETYFINWLNGYEMTEEKLIKVTASLYDQSEEPEYLTQLCVMEEFLVYENNTLEKIIVFLVEAFLNISFGNLDLGRKNISWVEYAVKHCVNKNIFSEEYGKGFNHMSKLLKIHLKLKQGTLRQCDSEHVSSDLFSLLSNKGKAMIYFAEFVLFGILPARENEKVPILKKLINLDNENYLWSWEMFLELNSVRRGNTLPSQDEIEAISKATELAISPEMHSWFVSFLCLILAEFVAYRINNDKPNGKIVSGNRVFDTNEEAVNFIKDNAKKNINNEDIQIKDCHNQWIIMKRYLRIFEVILPFAISDTDLANKCKILYKKLMPEIKNRDYEIFLEQGKKDYRLSIDILQNLLSKPENNSNKIQSIFAAIWKPDQIWKEHEISSLHFLNGCYFVMTKDVNNALMHWMQMDLNCETESKFLFIDFVKLHRIMASYDWSDQFKLDIVYDEIIKRLLENTTADAEKEKLTLLKLKMENTMKIGALCCRDESGEDEEINEDVQYFGEIENLPMEAESLLNCENYFILWLDDYKMTEKKLDSITESLYQLIPPPNQQTEEEVKEDFEIYTMLTFQRVITPLVEGFLNILCGNIDLATKNISWVEYVVSHCLAAHVFPEEYADGINYLCGLTKIHAHLKLGDLGEREYANHDNNFATLTDKGKSMVLAAKWILNEQIHDRKLQAADDLKKVVNLDKENWVWNYVLCNRLRFLRRQGIHSSPDKEEIDAIARAVDFSSSMPAYHPMCISGLCQCLAEILNHRFYQRLPNGPVDIGTKIFQSEEEVIEYIKNKAREAFMNDIGFPEAIRYGEIFSSLLPFKHRDNDLAERCYNLCLERWPSNSKANHRMGILQLSGKFDVNKAIHYFKLAIEHSPVNFPARIDLIQTLLGSPRENQAEIEDNFRTFWEKEEFWGENEKFSIHFLEGCYFAMKDEIPRAVSNWIAHNSNTPSDRTIDFHQLERISKRHKWQRSANLNFSKIIDEIMGRQRTATVEAAELLERLKQKIQNVRRQTTRNTYRHHYVPNVNAVQEPAAPRRNVYIPPHLRPRQNQNNGQQNQGNWR